MRDYRIQQVAEMLLARQWGRASDFGDDPTDTVVEWPPVPPRPAARRTACGTVPPETEYEEIEFARD
jgi:hypothetical protein